MSLTITTNDLKAVMLFAAKQDVRYYLMGVCLEVTAAKEAILVATNGHALLALHAGSNTDLPDGAYILPTDALRAVLALKTKALALTVNDARQIVCEGIGYTITPIDGKFPDWRRVVPTPPAKDDEKPAQFDADYLAAFAKAAQYFGSKAGYYYVHQNGEGNSRVTFSEHVKATGVIMPLRADHLNQIVYNIPAA